MKFIIGEGLWNMIDRLSYRGGIGLFFNSTFTGLLAYALFFLFCILAAIGLFTVIRWIISSKKRKETPGQYWSRTGRRK